MSIKSLILALAISVTALSTLAQQAGSPPNPLDTIPEKMPFDTPYGAPISLEQADAAIKLVVAEAKKRNWKMSVAVVDSGGNLVAFQRMDGGQLASIQVSEHKARAAVNFRRDTKVFENAVQQNNFHYVMTLDGVIAARGGIPLISNGKIIGAVGCSGGTGSQDELSCKAAADSFK